MQLPFTLIIKAPPISWNEIYQQRHWSMRKRLAERLHYQVRSALIDQKIPIINKKFFLNEKVNISITCYFKTSPLDSDNIPAKLYIDGLKMMILLDDNINYIGKVTTESKIDTINPRVEIYFSRYENN